MSSGLSGKRSGGKVAGSSSDVQEKDRTKSYI